MDKINTGFCLGGPSTNLISVLFLYIYVVVVVVVDRVLC